MEIAPQCTQKLKVDGWIGLNPTKKVSPLRASFSKDYMWGLSWI